MAFQDFTNFSVWKLGFNVLSLIYKKTKTYPSDERFGMISDMRRAANSVIHNIAEGYGRYENRDKTRFYKISRGSAYELISQLLVSENLGYITKNEANELISFYKQIINETDRLIKAVESR